MTQTATEKTDQCIRCQGKGELKSCQHVLGGVCFRCWGCGLDLPTIEKRLEAVLEAARREYRKALRSKAPEGTLAEIAVRGNKAARAYKAQIADHAALAARYQSAR